MDHPYRFRVPAYTTLGSYMDLWARAHAAQCLICGGKVLDRQHWDTIEDLSKLEILGD